MEWDEFSSVYCTVNEMDPDGLRAVLQAQADRYIPEGWFLARCELMDSSRFGQVVILPFGGGATFQSIPAGMFSPRGQASDMSTVVGSITLEDFIRAGSNSGRST